jgi:ABC-type polysaccharide/polyol phosphate transport system ATPase subunit
MSDAIVVDRVSKLYRRSAPGFKLRTLKSALVERSLTGGLRPEEAIAALEDVSFRVARGEAFGVIGGNGSGKSTLLKVVAGILKPSAGTVIVNGRLSALIELGAGFHPEISGRENVFINGAVLGLSRAEIARRYDSIVEFSGLGDFLEEPVKNYSSGMYVRLGFAVAVHTDPDVLLVDEVLAVGDEAFAHRCLRHIEEMLRAGKTILFVSHSLDLVEGLCDRVLWLDHGRPQLTAEPRRAIDAYRMAVAEEEERGHRDAKAETPAAGEGETLRWGSGAAEITGARLLDGAGVERYHFRSGEPVRFEISARAAERLDDFVFGVGVSTPRGVECFGTNTDLAGFVPGSWQGEATAILECPALRLGPGDYMVDVAVHARDGAPYDYRRRALSFSVTSAEKGVGVYFPEHRWDFRGALSFERAGERSDDGRGHAGRDQDLGR